MEVGSPCFSWGWATISDVINRLPKHVRRFSLFFFVQKTCSILLKTSNFWKKTCKCRDFPVKFRFVCYRCVEMPSGMPMIYHIFKTLWLQSGGKHIKGHMWRMPLLFTKIFTVK